MRRKKFQKLKLIRSIRDESLHVTNDGRLRRLLEQFPDVKIIHVLDGWTCYVTVEMSDGYEYMETGVFEYKCIKKLINRLYVQLRDKLLNE